MVRDFVQGFHPDSAKVKALDKKEIERRVKIFSERISQAIDEDGRKGFGQLKELMRELLPDKKI